MEGQTLRRGHENAHVVTCEFLMVLMLLEADSGVNLAVVPRAASFRYQKRVGGWM